LGFLLPLLLCAGTMDTGSAWQAEQVAQAVSVAFSCLSSVYEATGFRCWEGLAQQVPVLMRVMAAAEACMADSSSDTTTLAALVEDVRQAACTAAVSSSSGLQAALGLETLAADAQQRDCAQRILLSTAATASGRLQLVKPALLNLLLEKACMQLQLEQQQQEQQQPLAGSQLPTQEQQQQHAQPWCSSGPTCFAHSSCWLPACFEKDCRTRDCTDNATKCSTHMAIWGPRHHGRTLLSICFCC
jgi:hypothetical protein